MVNPNSKFKVVTLSPSTKAGEDGDVVFCHHDIHTKAEIPALAGSAGVHECLDELRPSGHTEGSNLVMS